MPKIFPMNKTRLSIIDTIEEAYNRHIVIYEETPQTVLLGPEEVGKLIEEMMYEGYELSSSSPCIMVCDMIVVPKITNGIDFPISMQKSSQLYSQNYKKLVAEKFN